MTEALNENEPLTFTRIGVAASRVIDRLDSDKQKNEDCGGNREPKRQSEKEEEQNRNYVDHRLREWRAWERRINGKG